MPAKNSALIPSPKSALDQAAPLPNLPRMIDGLIASINKSKDVLTDFNLVTRLGDFGKISGVGQAAALWTIREKVRAEAKKEADRAQMDIQAETADMQFEQIAFTSVGYAPDTVRRYLLAWDFMNEARPKLDDKTWELLLNRHVQDLIALGQARKEHGPFKVSDLKKLAKAPDLMELRKAVKKANGLAEAKAQAIIRIHPDGTLVAWEGAQSQIIGALYVPEAADQGLGVRARARLIKRARIQEV